ncbi:MULTISPECIES: XisH family protein [unclassified Tolypothrix]|uniref:XisH family protein n=1 Tax=unclassified Tolypothrix TaxID=2649714 RepID=UPI0005EAB9C7|nr:MULTISPECIES: XisH family protein [unclassified Tolypothrix]BAY94257.1 fdxN element excision controlling factor protein [Microchaete diplosiphon NIES-3275]EKF03996.1 heterocyst differentiation protein [Tolypothrix sp. PCC 7601]MBE9087173.1 XisH family protein [Tolypothrix sp. LEGE 11397]UYD27999.1 XisH family protein [Tolypothrix sp. PCC 7712]UYD36130.1 XisH family protein [Tolypothrix sp. PCC 7601]
MSAKDIFHDIVKAALQKDGWLVNKDPLYLRLGDDQIRIDLGAERLIVAEREKEQIAVEVKSFLAPSALNEFHTALGQFLNYRAVLQIQQPQRKLYLAVTTDVYRSFFLRDLPQLSIQVYELKIIIFDPVNEVIVEWIN